MRTFIIHNIRISKVDFTSDSTDSKTIIKEYHEPIFTNKFDNLGEMKKFFEKRKHLQEEIENLNSPTSIKEIKFVVKNFPIKKL